MATEQMRVKHTEMLNASFYRYAYTLPQEMCCLQLASSICLMKEDCLSMSHVCRWIQEQHANHRSELWRNGLEEYLQYGRSIQDRYPLPIDSKPQSIAHAEGGLCRGSQSLHDSHSLHDTLITNNWICHDCCYTRC